MLQGAFWGTSQRIPRKKLIDLHHFTLFLHYFLPGKSADSSTFVKKKAKQRT